jgi:hypothetical protein
MSEQLRHPQHEHVARAAKQDLFTRHAAHWKEIQARKKPGFLPSFCVIPWSSKSLASLAAQRRLFNWKSQASWFC